MRRHIVVTDYQPLWEQQFEMIAAMVRRILGDNCVAIHHIGSTSVKGLSAKPTIDVLPVVKRIEAVDGCQACFEAEGFEYLGEYGITGRRYLRQVVGEDDKAHLHIFSENSQMVIIRHLAVRDYLRQHYAEAEAYAALKKELAMHYPYDVEGYCDGKDAFVQALERRALAWYKNEQKKGGKKIE